MSKKKSKVVGEESHVYDEHGNLEGLYTIDGKEVRRVFGDRKFWEGVDEIVRLYTQINPTEMAVVTAENYQTRQDNKNDFGSDKHNVYRHALSIPHGLYLALIDFEQTLFRNKKTRERFMKRYPNLRSCNTV